MASKIYCFINGKIQGIGDLSVVALAEDGEQLAGHVSSSESYAKHDIGINSTWKHDKYKAHYPDGYELVWLTEEECNTNTEFLALIEKLNSEPETQD